MLQHNYIEYNLEWTGVTIEARGQWWCFVCSIFIETVKKMGLKVQPLFANYIQNGTALKTVLPSACHSSRESIQRGFRFRPFNHSTESQRPGSRPPLSRYRSNVTETQGGNLIGGMILNKLVLEMNTFKCIFRQWNLNTTAHMTVHLEAEVPLQSERNRPDWYFYMTISLLTIVLPSYRRYVRLDPLTKFTCTLFSPILFEIIRLAIAGHLLSCDLITCVTTYHHYIRVTCWSMKTLRDWSKVTWLAQ